jgi:hypothetical protein
MWHTWERREMPTGFWSGNPEETLGRRGHRWAENIIMDLTEVG